MLTAGKRSIPWLLVLGVSSVFAADSAGKAAPGFVYHDHDILGTSLDLTVTAASQADAEKAHEVVLGEIERLRKILSTYDPATDLSQVNAARTPVKVAKEVLTVLHTYDQWMTATKGAYSGRIGELVGLWKKAEKENALPSKEAIAGVLAEMKKPLWKLDDKNSTVTRTSDAAINIDSLGKGFIASRAAAVAREKVPAVRGLMLNIGGDITAVGTSSQTAIEPWTVAVADPAHPADNATPLTTLKLAGLAVATSGGYERGYTIGAKKYSHLLNPVTGYPVDFDGLKSGRGAGSVASATVVARDNESANALAASLNVLSVDDGLALVNKTLGAEALIVLNDGTQVRSTGFKRLEDGKIEVPAGWPNGFTMDLAVQFQAGRERPYVAVWIENSRGAHVATLAEWGNNQKYIRSLSLWSRAVQGVMNVVNAAGVTRATRPSGSYKLTWDGKDMNGQVVPADTYKVTVEFVYEHNGHSSNSTTIECAGQPVTATIRGTQHFADVAVSYGKTH